MAKTRSSKKRSAMETSPSSSPSPAAKKPALVIPKQSQSPPPSTPPPPPGLTLLLKKSPSTPPGFEKKPPPVPLKSSSLSSALSPQLNLLYDQVFTALPQTPHFNPLSKYSENIREGIKQGYDIAFLKLVERFQNFADPSTFLTEVEDLTREFKEFEEVGYDLTKVKERFNLLKLRAEQEKEWKDVAEKLEEEKKERQGKIDLKEIRLVELAEETARVEKEVEMEKSEVKRIESKKQKFMESSNMNAKRFRNMASVPW